MRFLSIIFLFIIAIHENSSWCTSTKTTKIANDVLKNISLVDKSNIKESFSTNAIPDSNFVEVIITEDGVLIVRNRSMDGTEAQDISCIKVNKGQVFNANDIKPAIVNLIKQIHLNPHHKAVQKLIKRIIEAAKKHLRCPLSA